MSEEFDKEAEREKLRQKLEKDQEKRQETQRMSELLLQGATMTNKHCDNCGDPLFRDGEETFCPTCGGADAEEQETQPQQIETEPQTSTEPQEQFEPTGAATTPQQAGPVDDTPTSTERTAEPASTTTGVDPRTELQRAVARSAQKANEATDPRTATEWLEASKEAAEALAALGR